MIAAMVLGASRAAQAISAVLGVGAVPPVAAVPGLPAEPAEPEGPDGYLAAGPGVLALGPEPELPALPTTVTHSPFVRPVEALGPLLWMKRPANSYYRLATRLPCPACGNDCTWLGMRLDVDGKDLTWWDFGGECGCPASVDLEVLMQPATAVAVQL